MMLGVVMVVGVLLTLARVDVHGHIHQGRQFMEQGMPNFLGDVMAFVRGQFAIHGDVQLGALPVSHPADGSIVNRKNTIDMLRGVFDKMGDFRVHGVHDAEVHVPRGIPHDDQDGNADQ